MANTWWPHDHHMTITWWSHDHHTTHLECMMVVSIAPSHGMTFREANSRSYTAHEGAVGGGWEEGGKREESGRRVGGLEEGGRRVGGVRKEEEWEEVGRRWEEVRRREKSGRRLGGGWEEVGRRHTCTLLLPVVTLMTAGTGPFLASFFCLASVPPIHNNTSHSVM